MSVASVLTSMAESLVDALHFMVRVFRDTVLWTGAAGGILAFTKVDELLRATPGERIHLLTNVMLLVLVISSILHFFVNPKGKSWREWWRLDNRGDITGRGGERRDA